MSKKILIVEDEMLIAKAMKIALEKFNLNIVGISNSHEETAKLLKQVRVDLILMDINIYGPVDGIQSCNILYQKYKIPTIFISGFSDYETLKSIEDSYANGYIIKPFKYEQLYIQIYLILNKKKSNPTLQKNNKINLENEFSYCIQKKILFYNNREINLTKKEKELLYVLCKNKNNYVSYEYLYNQVWEHETFSINKIRGSIFRIKRKLPHLIIHNNKEYGYCII